MKKQIVLVLAATMAMSFAAGCAKKEQQGASPSPQASGPASSAAASGSAPVTYTISTTEPKLTWDTPISKKLTEKTGVSFKYVPVIGGADAAGQKYDLWLASGDYPDTLFLQPKTLGKYRDAGALQPLEDLIDQYGPNIKKRFGSFYNLLKDQDGHIYSLYNPNLAQETPADQQASFVVQYDVLKEAGYPTIKTLDELYDVLKAYYEKHPTIDGQPTIPFSGVGTDLVYNNPAVAAAGQPDHGRFLIDADGSVNLNLDSPESEKYYQFLNKLYTSEMLDKEIFTLNYDTAPSKIAQGRILAGYYPKWFLDQPEQSLRQAGKADRQYAKFPILFDANTEDHSNAIVASGSGNNWAISKNAKNPERIIQFIDYLFTDEGQKLIGWGIEGVDYEIKDGKRYRSDEVVKKMAADPDYGIKEGLSGSYSRFSIGNGAKLEDGDYATPLTREYVVRKYDSATKEILAKYGKETWSDFLPQPEYIPAFLWQIPEPEGASALNKRLEQIWNKESPQIVMAKDFASKWNGYKKQMESSGEKQLEDLFTQAWKSYESEYNKAVGK